MYTSAYHMLDHSESGLAQSIDDGESRFSATAFRIQYCDQEYRFNEGCLFRMEIDPSLEVLCDLIWDYWTGVAQNIIFFVGAMIAAGSNFHGSGTLFLRILFQRVWNQRERDMYYFLRRKWDQNSFSYIHCFFLLHSFAMGKSLPRAVDLIRVACSIYRLSHLSRGVHAMQPVLGWGLGSLMFLSMKWFLNEFLRIFWICLALITVTIMYHHFINSGDFWSG